MTTTQVNSFYALNPSQIPSDLKGSYDRIKTILDKFGIEKVQNNETFVEGFNTFWTGYNKFAPATKMTTSSTARKPQQAKQQAKPQTQQAKSKNVRDPKAKSTAKRSQFAYEKQQLLEKIAKNRTLVQQNAKYKKQVAEELKQYLQDTRVAVSLGASPEQVELQKLRVQNKFYVGILKADSEDFRNIAKRLGLSFQNKETKQNATTSKSAFWDFFFGK